MIQAMGCASFYAATILPLTISLFKYARRPRIFGGLMERPAVSLVICTRNRADKLSNCLEYIAKQTPTCSWELVIVDNGSSDATSAIISSYATKVPFATKELFEGTTGKSYALNRGWQAAAGEIIAFTDDDCYVSPEYIDRVKETFKDVPTIGFAGGRVDLFDPDDYPVTIMTSEERELFAPSTIISPGRLHGANMMFRRSVLEEIGGFDPDFGPGTSFVCEDLDVQARASLAGWSGLYTPDVIVAHHHGRKKGDIPGLMRSYSLGLGAHLAKLALVSETRSIVLPWVLRSFYWSARKVGREYLGAHKFIWQIRGAANYLTLRLRKHITACD